MQKKDFDQQKRDKKSLAPTKTLFTCLVIGHLGLFGFVGTAHAGQTKRAPGGGSQATMSNQLKTIAHEFVECLAGGNFARATTFFDPAMTAALPAEKLKTVWQQVSVQYGAFKKPKVLSEHIESLGPHTIFFIPCSFGGKTLDLKIVFSGSNKISGFFLQPHVQFESGKFGSAATYKEAPYSKADGFSDRDLKVGEGKWQLDGCLSIPVGDGPFPCVILVHGSGPNDKDETIGPNKPFRDLAHGLASRGIAVLRYEKRTRQYQNQIKSDIKHLTVKEETLDDVTEAIKTAGKNAKVDPKKIFVLGHSLGGMLLPRILASNPDVKGFISMAGSNEPLEDAIVRQTRYIASLNSGTESTTNQLEQDELKKLQAQAEKIRKLTDADADSSSLICGAAPAYWLDLKKHPPLDEIKYIDRPVIFLQGGRDYQVTADGDFQRWKQAIQEGGKSNLCQFKLYPDLNHLFIAGSGKATPTEYMSKSGHVDAQVVADIAAWLQDCCKN